jgi:hypothetical protein
MWDSVEESVIRKLVNRLERASRRTGTCKPDDELASHRILPWFI